MSLNKARTGHYLRNFEFGKLFAEELGWDRLNSTVSVQVDGKSLVLNGFAEKRGVQVFECPTLPDYNLRRKVEKQVAQSAYEHLIIFRDEAKTTQVWQWVARGPGRPAAYREHTYTPDRQPGDALIQKLGAITIPLSEEEALDLTGTVHKLRDAFDRDRVTKRFFDHFQKEHKRFLGFIQGITEKGDQEWYASLMLNRMMFIYFIQKKGFLDDNPDYLRDRLTRVQERRGRGKFQTFFRYFLLQLFQEGFSKQKPGRKLDAELTAWLGEVPYLNGGLFDVHDLERKHQIDIPDEAFEKLFDFFDQYVWHLDTRPLRNDREINPDVLGYIFEKYINQKQMGAYYTKEDITDYIGKNTIVPFLFDAAEQKCKVAFEPKSALWKLLAENPDRYIYPAVRRGVIDAHGEVIPLPPEIEKGVHDVAQRGGWNRPATPPYNLPTETWREHVARRQRCLELRKKLQNGEVHRINDLITWNLDIRQFAEDAIEGCEGPELLRAFYYSIAGRVPQKSNEKFQPGISVLDPTCGSGAFLFAALNILEPLYEACLDRMEAFVDDHDRSGKPAGKKYEDFRHVLEDVRRHPNRAYFILKSIVVHNLYGVDIMEEAVEICKLRLFLKLVAQIDKAQDLEPLPDIDFNIRPGNTLVGFASFNDVERCVTGKLDFDGDLDKLREEAEVVDSEFRMFHDMQTMYAMDGSEFAESKQRLRQKLDALADQLDLFLAGDYGIDTTKPQKVAGWQASHRPFHWFAEFYGIMARGGFDVIIGNPPWKEYAAVKKDYQVRGYRAESCGNLHGICTERAIRVRAPTGRFSFIVQLPLTCSSRMQSVRSVLQGASKELHVVPFDDRPGKLFDGLEHCRSVIFLSAAGSTNSGQLLTTRYQRWPTEGRSTLFAQFEYAHASSAVLYPGLFPKYATDLEVGVFEKVRGQSRGTLGTHAAAKESKSFVFYQEATQYWVKATIGLPFYSKDGVVGAPSHGRYAYFDKPGRTAAAMAILNSSLFYAYFIGYGDCFHLSDTLVTGFPIPADILDDEVLAKLGQQLNADLVRNAVRKTIQTKDGSKISYAEFRASESKPLIDQIDARLAGHYGFTPEELDFIINYDIKYRLGADDGEDDE